MFQGLNTLNMPAERFVQVDHWLRSSAREPTLSPLGGSVGLTPSTFSRCDGTSPDGTFGLSATTVFHGTAIALDSFPVGGDFLMGPCSARWRVEFPQNMQRQQVPRCGHPALADKTRSHSVSRL